jgi:hypothetical protein
VTIYLAIQAAFLCLFGVYAFLKPRRILPALGLEAKNSNGVYETRGVYGGVNFGFGALCALSLFYASLQQAALILLATFGAGYVFARILGVLFDGLPARRFFVYFAYELITLVVSLYFLGALT